MTTIEKILDRLRKYPNLSYRVEGDAITIDAPSPTGFSVSLAPGPSGFTVVFGDGWHEEFEDESDALNCFAFGLSNQCRLKVYRRGRTEYRWTVERATGDGWQGEGTVGLLFFPFWCRRQVEYRQNAVIEPNRP